MYDLIITIVMIICGSLSAGIFWEFSNKGFKGTMLSILGAVLGAAVAYLISLVVWLFVTIGCAM